MDDAIGLVDGLYPGAAAAGLRDFPESARVTPPRIGEVYTKGTLTLARLGREAPIAVANPAGPVLRNVEGGSLAARLLYPDGRQDAPGEPAALAGHRHRRPRPVRAARGHRAAAQAPARPLTRGARVADPRAIRVRARDERRGRDRGAAAARLRGAHHRRRPQPAADDEAAPGQPRAPGRHQRPRRARLHPRGRDGEIRIGALTRHVDLLKSELLARALPALPRRRGR